MMDFCNTFPQSDFDIPSIILSKFTFSSDFWFAKCYQYGVILFDPDLVNSQFFEQIPLYSLAKNSIVMLSNQMLEMASENVTSTEKNRAKNCYLDWLNNIEARDAFYKIKLDKLRRKKFTQVEQDFKTLLEQKLFLAADEKASMLDKEMLDAYELVKGKYIHDYLSTELHIDLNVEQCLSISKISKNLLVAARAGSGKTTMLAAKTAILIKLYGINPDELMILTFNDNAAKEIRQRIRNKLGIKQFTNARTFHSLGNQLLRPENSPVYNQKGDNVSQEFTEFVTDSMNKILTPGTTSSLYKFFKKEMNAASAEGEFLNNEEYFIFLRNCRDITLNGERVKSKGEKYIADFLFECGLDYAYEVVEQWKDHPYRPDFMIKVGDKKIIIEHWGIDELAKTHKVPAWWSVSWNEYLAEMQEKRAYWKDKNIPLIETSVRDLYGNREEFEILLEERLSAININCKKIDQKELEDRVKRIQHNRLVKLIEQFIQKAKKQALSPNDLAIMMEEYVPVDDKEKFFIRLGQRVYLEYEDKLSKESKIDYDDMISKATKLIEDTKGDCSISFGPQKEHNLKINQLKWILIDEYQDFSFLFNQLIQSIIKYNQTVNLVVVGDDWQAINGFAGSDLKFFDGFSSNFLNTESCNLLTNHRSCNNIVETGNLIMKGFGVGGRAEKTGGEISIIPIDKIYIDRKPDENDKPIDHRFIFYINKDDQDKINDVNFIQAKYLKKCYEILVEPENYELLTKEKEEKDGKVKPKVVILSRTNNLYKTDLVNFLDKLKNCFSKIQRIEIGDFEEKVQISTVHSFKGLEADIVILLKVIEGDFPIINSDSYLFRIFGQTEKQQLEEERRLFYVAVTRASEKIYILTENDRRSPFIKDIVNVKDNHKR